MGTVPASDQHAQAGEQKGTMKLILITMDSLRADHTSWHGYELNTTPNLARFSRGSWTFLNGFAAGHLTTTSFKALLSSSYPLEWSPGDTLTHARPVVSEMLGRRGALTAAVVANPLLSSRYGWDRGFDLYMDYCHAALKGSAINSFSFRRGFRTALTALSRFAPPLETVTRFVDRYRQVRTGSTPYPNAGLVRKTALDWLRCNHNRRFFLWVHFNEPHSPYIPPKSHETPFPKPRISDRGLASLLVRLERNQGSVTTEEVRILRSLYDARVHYVDAEVGAFLCGVEELGLLEDTMVIVTSDHGEEFRDHGEIGHGHMKARPKLYDEIVHVPLLVRVPGQREGRTVESLVSHVDLLPTVLDWHGTSEPDLRGRSLAPLLRDESATAEHRGAAVPDEREAHPTREEGRSRVAEGGVWAEFEIGGNWVISYRTRRFKYIHDERTGDEFYDLENDPGEKSNLIEDAALAEELRRRVYDHKSFLSKIRSQAADLPERPDDTDELRRRLSDLGYTDD